MTEQIRQFEDGANRYYYAMELPLARQSSVFSGKRICIAGLQLRSINIHEPCADRTNPNRWRGAYD